MEYTHTQKCDTVMYVAYLNRHHHCADVSQRKAYIPWTRALSRSIPMANDETTDFNSAELQPFAYQVGGHKGVQITGEGALIVKAAMPLELHFYQNILTSPTLSSLRPWVPTYLGTLRLEGQNTAEGVASVEGIPETEKDECSKRYLITSRTDKSIINTDDSSRKRCEGISKTKYP